MVLNLRNLWELVPYSIHMFLHRCMHYRMTHSWSQFSHVPVCATVPVELLWRVWVNEYYNIKYTCMPKVVHMADVFIQENSRHLADVSIYSTDWFSVESFRNHSTRTTVQIMVRQLTPFVADHTNETTVEDGRRKSFCCHHFHRRDNTQPQWTVRRLSSPFRTLNTALLTTLIDTRPLYSSSSTLWWATSHCWTPPRSELPREFRLATPMNDSVVDRRRITRKTRGRTPLAPVVLLRKHFLRRYVIHFWLVPWRHGSLRLSTINSCDINTFF